VTAGGFPLARPARHRAGGPPPEPADSAEAEAAGRGASSTTPDLFGRGLLYVVVWSLQLVTASLVSPVLAHIMGPAEFGRLASAIALYQVLIVLATVGLDQAIILERVREGGAHAARGLLAVGILVASLVMLAAVASATWWGRWLGFGGLTPLLVATVLWTAPGAAVQLMMALLRSEDRLRAFAVLSCLSALGGQLFGIGLLLAYSRAASTYAWGGVISLYLAVAIGIVVTRPLPRGLLAGHVLARAARLGLPLVVSSMCVFVLNAGDRVIIQRLLGAAEVGRYQVAYTVGYVVVLLLGFTSQAWTPRIAAVVDHAQRWELIGRSRDELYRLLIPVLLGITLAAPVLLRVFAPPSFRPGTLLVVVFLVALSAFPVAANGASTRALVSVRRSRPLAAAAAVAAAGNIALNVALVPVLGIAGSALATLIAFSVQAALQRLAVPRVPRWPRIQPSLTLAVVAAAVAGGLSVLVPQTPAWNAGRFALALACLPWFLLRLRQARGGTPRSRGRHRPASRTPWEAHRGRPVRRAGGPRHCAEKRARQLRLR
jgi:O-antigen/teichoic acid export membrane protein